MRGKNAFCITDERFSAGDKKVENVGSNFSPRGPHSYICSYQRLSNRTLKNATHSPSKTGGSHPLILTCECATPTMQRCSLHAWLRRNKKKKMIMKKDVQN